MSSLFPNCWVSHDKTVAASKFCGGQSGLDTSPADYEGSWMTGHLSACLNPCVICLWSVNLDPTSCNHGSNRAEVFGHLGPKK